MTKYLIVTKILNDSESKSQTVELSDKAIIVDYRTEIYAAIGRVKTTITYLLPFIK